MYVQGEIVNKKLPKIREGYRVYCSEHNIGAAELMHELIDVRRELRRCIIIQDVEMLQSCDVVLIYLTGLTWTSGDASEAFAHELRRAMDVGVDYVLAHEMVGSGGQEARHGCEFSAFFACEDGTTPGDLLRRGIYAKIAVPLKGGPWRETSMMMLAQAFFLLTTGDELNERQPSLDHEASAAERLFHGLVTARRLTGGSSSRIQLRTVQIAELLQRSRTRPMSGTQPHETGAADPARF